MALSTTSKQFLNTSRDGDIHLPGEPIPVLNNPFCKDIFPDIQPKPCLVQLEAISPHPVAYHQWEETNSALTVSTFQILEESSKVFPQTPPPQTKQLQFQCRHNAVHTQQERAFLIVPRPIKQNGLDLKIQFSIYFLTLCEVQKVLLKHQ